MSSETDGETSTAVESVLDADDHDQEVTELEVADLFDDEGQDRILEAASQRRESPSLFLHDAILERVADVLGDEGHLECWNDDCEETFTSVRRRRGHVGREHSDNLPEGDFWCGICGYGPTTYSGVAAHHGQRHTGEEVRRLDHEPESDELLDPDDVPDHMDPELLERLYREHDGSITDLCRAHEFGVTRGRVRHYLIEFGIHEPTPQTGKTSVEDAQPSYRDPEWLRPRYQAADGNISEMHRRLQEQGEDVAYRTLNTWLKRTGIHDPRDPPGRRHGEGGPTSRTTSPDGQEPQETDAGVDDDQEDLEEPTAQEGESKPATSEDEESIDDVELLDHTVPSDLEEAYEEADGNIARATERFEVGYHAVRDWLIKFGIHVPETRSDATSSSSDEESFEELNEGADDETDRTASPGGQEVDSSSEDLDPETDESPETAPHRQSAPLDELGVDDDSAVESFQDIATPDWLDEGTFYAAVDVATTVDDLQTALGWGSTQLLAAMVELLDLDIGIHREDHEGSPQGTAGDDQTPDDESGSSVDVTGQRSERSGGAPQSRSVDGGSNSPAAPVSFADYSNQRSSDGSVRGMDVQVPEGVTAGQIHEAVDSGACRTIGDVCEFIGLKVSGDGRPRGAIRSMLHRLARYEDLSDPEGDTGEVVQQP